MEAVGGQKHPWEAKNGAKELIYWKKYLTKVSKQPQKPLSGSNQILATTSDKKDTSQQATSIKPKHKSARKAPKNPAKRDSYIIIFSKKS